MNKEKLVKRIEDEIKMVDISSINSIKINNNSLRITGARNGDLVVYKNELYMVIENIPQNGNYSQVKVQDYQRFRNKPEIDTDLSNLVLSDELINVKNYKHNWEIYSPPYPKQEPPKVPIIFECPVEYKTPGLGQGSGIPLGYIIDVIYKPSRFLYDHLSKNQTSLSRMVVIKTTKSMNKWVIIDNNIKYDDFSDREGIHWNYPSYNCPGSIM